MFLILKFLAFVVHKALLLNWESCLTLDQPSKTGARVAGRFTYQRLPFFCFYCEKMFSAMGLPLPDLRCMLACPCCV
ncbi:hypothetical protein NC652_021751 [Populus alba x Populus x berolinensis]|nr:hypothetical protein NC652_021751 [Populus alba x Populus x berolinensis]